MKKTTKITKKESKKLVELVNKNIELEAKTQIPHIPADFGREDLNKLAEIVNLLVDRENGVL